MSVLLHEHDDLLSCAPLDPPADDARGVDRIRAILADDDEEYRETARVELARFGFDVVPCASGDAVLDHLQRCNLADVIVLNWMFETALGIDVLRRLQERGIKVPVVFLTHSPATAYEYVALDRGAADFVDKARGIPILAKRLRRVALSSRRLVVQESHEPLQCDRLFLRPDTGRAYWSGEDVDLTVTEFRVVHLLASRAGEYVTYRSIYDCVQSAGFIAGSGDDGFRTNVRSAIRRIRNKFRALDADFSEIENYAAFGYRWGDAQRRLPRPSAGLPIAANDTV
jgi:two-component system, OmpR family, response regulator ChvI